MKRSSFHKKGGPFLILVIFFFLIFYPKDAFSSEGIIHIHTSITDGKDAPEVIMGKAAKSKISIIVYTDWFLRRWEYGIWPFRNLIKKRVEDDSVLSLGIAGYLKKIEELEE